MLYNGLEVKPKTKISISAVFCFRRGACAANPPIGGEVVPPEGIEPSSKD